MAAEGREEKTLSSSPTADEQIMFQNRSNACISNPNRFSFTNNMILHANHHLAFDGMHVGAASSTKPQISLQIVVLIAL